MKLSLAFLIATALSAVSCSPLHSSKGGSTMDDILKVNGNIKGLLFGDEMFTEDQKVEMALVQAVHGRSRRGLTRKGDNRRWPNKELHYTISNVFTEPQKRIIRSAASAIASKTCIRFIEYPVDNAPTAHVAISPGTGCSSFIGRIGNKQQLTLQQTGCVFPGIIMHEFLHALGIFHEQSRSDRDDFVTIHLENVQEGFEGNFNKQNTDSLGVPYDAASIMHYSSDAFSSNGQPTITWKEKPSRTLGGRELTDSDIKQLNLFYECPNTEIPTTTSTTTTRPTTTTARPKTTTRPTTIITRPTTTTTTSRPTTTTVTKNPTTNPATKSTPTTSPTDLPTGACGDSSYYCFVVESQKDRLCGSNKYDCPRTCGVCTSPASDICVNHNDAGLESTCSRLAARGYCQDSRTWYSYNMKRKCPRTCCDRGELYKYPVL